MPSTKKPTILLVHGAWHNLSCFSLIIPRLAALSYPVLAVSLPSSNASSPKIGIPEDIAAIHGVILPLMDDGTEIVIVAHSYGGIPGCASTEAQSVGERAARGKKGGVRAILFVSAFTIPVRGMSLVQTFGGRYPSFMLQQDGYAITGPGSREALYNDIDPSVGEAYTQRLRPQTIASFETPVHFIAADLKVPSTYMICEKDALLVPAFQEMLAVLAPGMKIERCPSGHSPFYSQPARTVAVIVKVAEGH